jgi:hypothetical protein
MGTRPPSPRPSMWRHKIVRPAPVLAILLQAGSGNSCQIAPRPEGDTGSISADAKVRNRNDGMEYKTTILLTRYGPPPGGPPEPTLTIFYARPAWDRFVAGSDGARDALARLSVDWTKSVLLLVRTVPEGGMDLIPEIAALARDGDEVKLQVVMAPNPNAQMADVIAQPWLLAESPADPFRGSPTIRFSVRGQPAGKVHHQR